MASATSVITLRPFLALTLGLLAGAVSGIAPAQVVEVDRATGRTGDTVEVTVRLVGQGSGASALRVNLDFDPAAPILAREGKPVCSVNPDILKESTSFVFVPAGCTAGIDCSGVRAGVISFSPENNAAAVPSGATFSCLFAIPAGASAEDMFRINVDSASAVFPDGSEIDISAASYDGSVRVVEAVLCPGDIDGNGDVALGEVQKAFDAYINGCSEE